jgi:hypothetical protein
MPLVGHPDRYELSDGTSWENGAGSFPGRSAPVDRVEVSGDTIRYILMPPADRVIQMHTDYDGGDYSSHGTLEHVGEQAIAWVNSGAFSGQPSVARGVVYAGGEGRLAAVDEADGRMLWSWSLPRGTPTSTTVVTDSYVFVSNGIDVYAVDASTGMAVWEYPAGGHLAFANGTLFIASVRGTLTAIACGGVMEETLFVRGDANVDGVVSVSDVVAIARYLFLEDPSLSCHDAADTDDGGSVQLNDAVLLLQNLFTASAAFMPPYPVCGADQTPDVLDCSQYPVCP